MRHFQCLVLGRSHTAPVDEASTLLAELPRDVRDEKDATRRLAIFELLGNQGELVSNYRRKLSTLMH